MTQVVPEYDSTQRVVGTQLALPSQVNIQGLTIHEGENALLFAPSANVSLAAGTWVFYEPDDTAVSEQSQFVSSAGQIYLDANAVIDVSGSKNISAPVSENVVAAQLLGPELANSPLQRNGPLRGQTVYVDVSKTGTYNGQNVGRHAPGGRFRLRQSGATHRRRTHDRRRNRLPERGKFRRAAKGIADRRLGRVDQLCRRTWCAPPR